MKCHRVKALHYGRQILHCTFGSVLTDEKFGPLVADILHQHPDTYTAVLDDHFTDILKHYSPECKRKETKYHAEAPIDPSKINEVLGRAGHIAYSHCRRNYPCSSTLGPNAELVSLNLSPGLPTCDQVLRHCHSNSCRESLHHDVRNGRPVRT